MTPGPTAEDLARSLGRHGMPVSWRHVAAKSRTPGEVFLDEYEDGDESVIDLEVAEADLGQHVDEDPVRRR